MKKPKTVNGRMKHIYLAVNELGYTIRKLWFCNAGWGMVYIPHDSENTIVFTYYDTIEKCISEEYDRIVLKKKIRGGFFPKRN